MCRPAAPAGVVSAAPVRYKTDDRVDSSIVTAAQVAMLGMDLITAYACSGPCIHLSEQFVLNVPRLHIIRYMYSNCACCLEVMPQIQRVVVAAWHIRDRMHQAH